MASTTTPTSTEANSELIEKRGELPPGTSVDSDGVPLGVDRSTDEHDPDEAFEPSLDFTFYGTTGLRQSGGYLDEEFAKELKGEKARKVYRQMADNDSTVGSILFAIRTLIEGVDYNVKAVDDSEEAAEAATFIEEVLDDMDTTMESVMSTVCTMFPYGFAPLELLYKVRKGPKQDDLRYRSKYDDNKIGLRGLAIRAQSTIFRWDIDEETGVIKGMWQQPYVGAQRYIPIEKVALFRTTDEKNNPEGRSLLRNAYRDWYFKTRIEELEAIGIEREFAGIPVARIPGKYLDKQAAPQDKAVARRFTALVKNLRRDNHDGIVLPSDKATGSNDYLFNIELLGAGSRGGRSGVDSDKVITRHDKGIATSVLADFIFLGQQAVGSFALSSDKTALFAQALEAFLGLITSVFSRQVIERVWTLNGGDPDLCPTMEHSKIEQANLQELGSYVTALAGAGMALFPDRELENSLRKAGNLPQAPEEEGDVPTVPPVPIVGPGAAMHVASGQAALAAEAEGGVGLAGNKADPKALPPPNRPGKAAKAIDGGSKGGSAPPPGSAKAVKKRLGRG